MMNKIWTIFWIAMGILSLMAIFMGAYWHVLSLAICIMMASVMMPKSWTNKLKR